MKAKLIIDNKELAVEITEEELEKFRTEPKHTGYERVKKYDLYYAVDSIGRIDEYTDNDDYYDQTRYFNVNCYSSKEVAANNARADKLMRQLRRFAVEHREKEWEWIDQSATKFAIYYVYGENKLMIENCHRCRDFGQIYFDTYATAQLAIDTFHDELIWYFTEYKDSV